MREVSLPLDVWNVLISTVGGVDVFGHKEAGELRRVESEYPELIEITECTRPYHGAGRLPYFNAKLTKAGCDAVRIETMRWHRDRVRARNEERRVCASK